MRLAAGLWLCLLAACKSNTRPNHPDCVEERDWGPVGTVPFRVQVVARGLEGPRGLAFLPDGDFLISERPGRVRVFHAGALLAQSLIMSSAQQGDLLGIAVDPRFKDNRRFYVYRSIPTGGGRMDRVERWNLWPELTQATFEAGVLDDIPGALLRQGGRLRFDRDGNLYVGTGDAARPELAQQPYSFAGKILRVTPSGNVPPGNPVPNSPTFVLGLRDVAGFDWYQNKTLVVADNGPSSGVDPAGEDEVSVARGGDNLGWPIMHACRIKSGLRTPAVAWRIPMNMGGAAFYTGSAIREWRGSLLIATLSGRHLHRVMFAPYDPERVVGQEVYLRGDRPTGYGRLREVTMGADGDMYVTTDNCDDGGVCPPEKDVVLRLTR